MWSRVGGSLGIIGDVDCVAYRCYADLWSSYLDLIGHNIHLRELLEAQPQPTVVRVPLPDDMLVARMREIGHAADFELTLISRVTTSVVEIILGCCLLLVHCIGASERSLETGGRRRVETRSVSEFDICIGSVL